MKNLRILSHLSLMTAVLLFACNYVYGYNYLRGTTPDQAPADSNYGNRYTDQNYPDSNYGDQSSTNSNSNTVNNYPNPYWNSPFKSLFWRSIFGTGHLHRVSTMVILVSTPITTIFITENSDGAPDTAE